MFRRSAKSGHARPGGLGRTLPATVGLGFMALFGGYAVVGPNGLLAWSDYRAQHQMAERELAALKAEQAALANRVRLLDPRGADSDLADELVRRELGVVRVDEVVLPLK